MSRQAHTLTPVQVWRTHRSFLRAAVTAPLEPGYDHAPARCAPQSCSQTPRSLCQTKQTPCHHAPMPRRQKRRNEKCTRPNCHGRLAGAAPALCCRADDPVAGMVQVELPELQPGTTHVPVSVIMFVSHMVESVLLAGCKVAFGESQLYRQSLDSSRNGITTF